FFPKKATSYVFSGGWDFSGGPLGAGGGGGGRSAARSATQSRQTPRGAASAPQPAHCRGRIRSARPAATEESGPKVIPRRTARSARTALAPGRVSPRRVEAPR